DGIRDLIVTGVQTCALPILERGAGIAAAPNLPVAPHHRPLVGQRAVRQVVEAGAEDVQYAVAGDGHRTGAVPVPVGPVEHAVNRSEERRVGLEGGAGPSPAL